MDDDKKREARKRQNREHHARAKARQNHALLRLDKGDLAVLDAASAAAGLSRSAFAGMFLLPMAAALALRIDAVERARAARRQSLGTFLARALDAQLAAAPEPLAPDRVAGEFDELFADGGD